ncbi:redoxin domain-containing protein [Acanthopleuribacter pedis]|uniref:Redoxin domain-containing protein n=1 Tax=Acanthopleuribacter pedis TaxID=442870 RepID=A0A8J7QFR4_9BACT|nr:TlpA disulfide reductase family protein [Acanthopleuribacter pedis]MBO1317650.1 redoxin domain-containing protein [Acanthopleuribacter pedis]
MKTIIAVTTLGWFLAALAAGPPNPAVVGPTATLAIQSGFDPEAYRLEAIRTGFKEIQALYADFKINETQRRMQQLESEQPSVLQEPIYQKLKRDMGVIHREAGNLKGVQWLQGKTELDVSPLTLVVFWESWCPHCQDSMPLIQKMFRKYHVKGLNVIGLTKITKPANMTTVIQFIAENEIEFSIGKDPGRVSEHFGVSGVPAAAIVKEGVIIWRGNPDWITEQTVLAALQAPTK